MSSKRSSTIIILAAVASALLLASICQATRSIEFRKIRSNSSPKYVYNFTTSLQNNSIYVDMNIVRSLQSGYRTHIEFCIRLKGSKKYQTLFAYNLNVCNMLIVYKDTLFTKWFRSLLKCGNFMRNCPIPEGHYYLNGWQIESELMPIYLHPGDYLVKGYGYFGKYRSKDEDFVASGEIELTLLVQ